MNSAVAIATRMVLTSRATVRRTDAGASRCSGRLRMWIGIEPGPYTISVYLFNSAVGIIAGGVLIGADRDPNLKAINTRSQRLKPVYGWGPSRTPKHTRDTRIGGFAPDSPLEGDGFELSVPREIARDIRAGD